MRVEEPKRYAQVEGGAFRVDADAREVRLLERQLGRVFVHPASVCFSSGSYKTGWLLFTEMVQTSKRFVREVSRWFVSWLVMYFLVIIRHGLLCNHCSCRFMAS